MFTSARRAYERVSKTTATSRELEATALFKAARRLEECREGWDESRSSARMVEALRYNQRLWTLFQTELADPSHPMPANLRADLLRLSAFVDRRTLELLAAPGPEGLQALIDIDRNVAAGLATAPA
jgi:flagellar protein FlaF